MKRASAVLYLSKVPPTQNSVHAILAHYKKYGHIQSIWAEGSNAVIRFEKEESAIAAYQDPVPFLMNRFIHVYFHKTPDDEESNLERFVDQKLVAEKCAVVSKAIQTKIDEGEELRKQMAEDNLKRQQQVMELRKKRSDFIIATTKLIGETSQNMDAMKEEDLSKMRDLMNDAQELLEKLESQN